MYTILCPNHKYMPTLLYNVAMHTTAPKEMNRNQLLLKSREKVLGASEIIYCRAYYYKEIAGSFY